MNLKITIALIVFIIINIVLAKLDSYTISKGRRIYHAVNGIVYIALLWVAFYLFKNYWLILALLFNRLLFFNIPLSLFRGKKWDYISPERKAITDRAAYFIFRENGKEMYLFYLICFIVTTILTYTNG